MSGQLPTHARVPSTPTHQIVTQDGSNIFIGEIVYFQDGQYGTPKGLLLALTNTPRLIKKIKSANGLREIN